VIAHAAHWIADVLALTPVALAALALLIARGRRR
jgi:hypothetical protein